METLHELIDDYGQVCRHLGRVEALDKKEGTVTSGLDVESAQVTVREAYGKLIVELTTAKLIEAKPRQLGTWVLGDPDFKVTP